MVSISQVQAALRAGQAPEYQCLENLNLYDAPDLTRLATQAIAGRQLRVLPQPEAAEALWVRLAEDDYPGWLAIEDLDLLELAETPYRPIARSPEAIQASLPQVIEFTQRAMKQPNRYLWGGTVGPNFDCSGLMQTAFLSAGIWLPRDAYQQEAFVQPIALEELQPGDLIFFGTPQKATHVGLHLGDRRYVHSSGREQGRNGIGIDVLQASGDPVSQAYYQQFRGAGRVVASFEAGLPTAIV